MQGRWLPRENGFGALDLALLIEIRLDDPLMQLEGGPRFIQNVAAVDDPQVGVHPQPQAFEGGGQVPGIDQRAIDRGLAAHGLKARPVKDGLRQGMAGKGLCHFPLGISATG